MFVPFIVEALTQRQANHTFRQLKTTDHLIDFCSNDYLGFAQSTAFKALIDNQLAQIPLYKTGATGSRLISSNTDYAEALEERIARFHQAEAGLIFNSGYDANVGLLSCLAQRGDTYLSDELIHASMIDGMRLSHAEKVRFRHNDLTDLEEKLKTATGNRFICVESLYSMDGDFAPLAELADLAERYQAYLIIDEAHATGVVGEQGRGLVNQLGLEDKVLARVHTFGKALGTHGAIVLGSKILKDYLINFARSFIFTTALPPHSWVAIDCAYTLLQDTHQAQRQRNLQDLIAFFREKAENLPYQLLPSISPIQGIIIPDAIKIKKIQTILEEAGFYAKAIVSPTVPAGTERLRICLHNFNTFAQIETLLLELCHAKI